MRYIKSKLFLFIAALSLLFINFQGLSQDLEVNQSLNAQQLVDILIGGGIQTMNATLTGAAISSGEFSGGPGNMGIEEGVILTCGSIFIAPGPNNQGGAGQNVNTGGDPDLTALAGVNTNDACILEFDFIPQSSIVSFDYVFGSEEYHEFIDQYNDVFGFFISGPGISGPYSNNSKNIALIPLSHIPVSINTVNAGNPYGSACDACEYFVNNTQNFLQYDAFTTVLRAWANVIPCEVYHIKLAIADGVDHVYDSGTFLEANSFTSVGIAGELEYDVPEYEYLIEGCNTAQITFTRDRDDIEMWMPLIIEGSAINGVDYLQIPDSVFFPLAWRNAWVDIIPVDDGNIEGLPETVHIIYNSSLCDIDYDTVSMWLKDYNEMYVETTPDTTINCNTSATLGIADLGGYAPYTVVWSTGDTSEQITVTPLITTTYYATVIALCDSAATDSVVVYVNGPEADAGEDQAVLYDTPAQLAGDVSSGSGDYDIQWEPAELLDDPTSLTPNTIPITQPVTFFLLVTDNAGGCMDNDEVFISYYGGPLGTAPTATPYSMCYGEQAQLFANPVGGDSLNYTFTWSSNPEGFNSNLQNPFVEPLETTTYYLLVNDGYNVVNGEVTINIIPLPEPEAGADQHIPWGTQTQLDGSGIGGSGNFDYQWEPAELLFNPTAQNPLTKKLFDPAIFHLSIIDQETGCASSETDLVTVFIDGGPLNVTASPQEPILCDGAGTMIYAAGGGGDTTRTYKYSWYSTPPIPGWPVVYDTASTQYFTPTQVDVTYQIEVVITDDSNEESTTCQVNVSSLPAVDLGDDIQACPYDTITISQSIPGDYLWSNGSTGHSVQLGSSGAGWDVKVVSLQVTNEFDCVKTDTVLVFFDIQNCNFGINELNGNVKLDIYPNPGTGIFNISIDGDGEIDCEVYNLQGQKLVHTTFISSQQNPFTGQISLEGHPPGIYPVRIIMDEQVYLGKIVLK